MVYKFFDKKSSESGIANEPKYQPTNELIRFRETIFGVLI